MHLLCLIINYSFSDVMSTVVAVWAEVGQWCLLPIELAQYLALFKAENPPLVSKSCAFFPSVIDIYKLIKTFLILM